MKSTIEFSPSYTMLTLELAAGESFKAEPGAMVAQQGVEMQTGMGGGGLFGGLKRMMGGESFFVNAVGIIAKNVPKLFDVYFCVVVLHQLSDYVWRGATREFRIVAQRGLVFRGQSARSVEGADA